MGKGGIYGKRKKQEKPKSFKEESSGGGVSASKAKQAVENYGSYTKTQGYDTGLVTTGLRRYERKRGKK